MGVEEDLFANLFYLYIALRRDETKDLTLASFPNPASPPDESTADYNDGGGAFAIWDTVLYN